MREIYPPPIERPLLQGGTLLRIFPFLVFHFTNLTPMDEVFFIFSCSKFDLRSIFCFLLVFLLFSSADIPFFQFLRIFYAYF